MSFKTEHRSTNCARSRSAAFLIVYAVLRSRKDRPTLFFETSPSSCRSSDAVLPKARRSTTWRPSSRESPNGQRDKDISGCGAENWRSGKTRAQERITLLSVKTRLDVFVSFRHALRVRPILCNRGSGWLPIMRFCRDIALLVAVFAVSFTLGARTRADRPRHCRRVCWPPSISKARVIDNLATRIGQPYSERNAEADIRALYATGGVANVRIFAEPYLDGGG